MKILAVSDQRLPKLSSSDFLRTHYADVKVVVSCGDLDPDYLDFIVSVLNVQLLYVRGNHDHYDRFEKIGGIDLHRQIVSEQHVSFAGLEGSISYNNSGIQYSEGAMRRNVLGMMPMLLLRRLLTGYGVDVFVAHSPPRDLNDASDYAHRGFQSFRWLIRWAQPRYFIHGHVDLYDQRAERTIQFYRTSIININPVMTLELDKNVTEGNDHGSRKTNHTN